MAQCPYHDQRGYCAKPTVVGITSMGMCNVLWRDNGQQKQLAMPFTDEMYPKEYLTIIDVAETEVSDVNESEIEEEGESRSEDLTNGDAANEQ